MNFDFNTKITSDIILNACWYKFTKSLIFELDENNQTYKVTGVGSDKQIIIPSTYNGLPVTSIGQGAFLNTDIIDVTMSDNIILIEDSVFKNCSNLVSIKLSTNLKTVSESLFENCIKLTSIDLPNNIESIGENAFKNCKTLKDIYISENLKNIGSGAFYNNYYLSNVYYKGTIEKWCNISFDGSDSTPMNRGYNFYMINNNEWNIITEIVIPKSVSTIGQYQFYSFDNLTSIKFTKSIKSFDKNVFDRCFKLNDVYFDGNISNWCDIKFNSIESNPMYYASNIYMKDNQDNYLEINNLIIPDTVTSIGDYQFAGFDNLRSINIPDTVTLIGQSALENCNNLNEISLPFIGDKIADETHTNFGYIFGAYNYSLNKDYVPTSLKQVIITNDITIDDYSFYDCDSLTNIFISNNIESIGSNAFYGCDNLEYNYYENGKYLGSKDNLYLTLIYFNDKNVEELLIHPNTRIIYNNAVNSSSIKNVIIHSNVIEIGSSAFSSASNLTNVYYNGNIANWCQIKFKDYSSNPMETAQHFYMKNKENEWEELFNLEIPESILTLNDYQFCGFENIESLTITKNVTKIGYSTFAGCLGLKRLYYDNEIDNWCNFEFLTPISNPMYYANNFYIKNDNNEWFELNEINISNKISTINNYQFIGFSNIIKIVLPDTIEKIGEWAFYNCTSLEKIIIPNSVESVGDNLFENCNELKELSIPKIFGDSLAYLFDNYNCPENLIKLSISNTEYLPKEAFLNCYYLKDITICGKVKSIGPDAFKGCSNLENIYFSGNIEDWCNISFYNINSTPMKYAKNLYIYDDLNNYVSLIHLELPDTVKIIGPYQFYGINSIIDVKFNNIIEAIGEYAFGYCNVEILKIPETVAIIGQYAFIGCKNLKEINLPIKLKYIENGLFKYCKNLVEVNIQGDILSIGDEAFYNCSSLTEIILPDVLNKIGKSAFYNCSSLSQIIIPYNVKEIGDFAFEFCNNLTIKCEISSKPTGWNNYWNFSKLPVIWGYDNE